MMLNYLILERIIDKLFAFPTLGVSEGFQTSKSGLAVVKITAFLK